MPRGFVYLCALIDIHSRFIISWNLSLGMNVNFYLEMLASALEKYHPPEIINSDKGSQFTSQIWIKFLSDNNIKVSICGKGRWADNIIMERFWRSLKQEQIYINPPSSFEELKTQISKFIDFYNNVRPHQSLNYQTPASLYFQKDYRSKKITSLI